MKASGKFKIYFATHNVAPLVWCVQLIAGTDPLWEVAVRAVGFTGVVVETMYQRNKPPDDEDGKPSAWLEATGELEVLEDGCAVIRAVA